MDGFHTMAVGLANVSYALLANRAAHDRVRADPSLVTAAFYEGVRLETAATFTQRYALDDLVHHDVAIPQGTPITMLWYAGNRDPAAFEQPDSYDIGRSIGGGTTFGGGIHLCPGRSITKLLAEIVLTALTHADVRVSLTDSTPTWLAGSSMHQLERMPVSFTRL
jgi:cytochrome P450